MKSYKTLHGRAFTWLQKHVSNTRPPDHIISGESGEDNPYLLRWYVIPRNPFFNVYFHNFRRSDDDCALHDHPWWNVSWLLNGDYQEEVPADRHEPQGERKTLERWEGALVFRLATSPHRVLLWRSIANQEWPVWTLFVTGPRFRKWGFWCPHSWRFWEDYTNNKPGVSTIGRECD